MFALWKFPGGGNIALVFIVSKLEGESGNGSSGRSRLSVVKGLELIIAVVSAINVRKASSFKELPCVLNIEERIDRTDLICLSQTPPI